MNYTAARVEWQNPEKFAQHLYAENEKLRRVLWQKYYEEARGSGADVVKARAFAGDAVERVLTLK